MSVTSTTFLDNQLAHYYAGPPFAHRYPLGLSSPMAVFQSLFTPSLILSIPSFNCSMDEA
jgi:hypothetical protein